MINQEVSDYIKKSRKNNISDGQIKSALVQNGWSEQMVNEAFGKNPIPVPVSPQVPTPPSYTENKPVSKNGMWDAFEHIIMFISLYVLATSIVLVLQIFVDKWIPDISSYSSYSYYDSLQSMLIRGYLASLIVSFPLFSFLFIQITKRTIKNPNIRNLKSRKVFIYTTLVGTFIIMLSNIIFIVYELLNGNVSFNFVLKFAITIAVSAGIFTYYILQIKEDRILYG
jgi:hypothetical protein